MAAKTTDWRPGPTVCRCCLSEGCYKDISTEYFWMGKREVYSEMLSETFSLSIAYSTSGGPNSNSRLICEPCISRLRDASDFKRQVQECEKTFMQYLDPGTERLSDFETAESRIEVTLESLETEVKVEQVKTEKDESDGDDFGDRTDFPDLDDDDDDLDDQPLTRLATRVPKKESVDTEADSKPEKRKATTKAKTSPAKKAKTKKEVVKATTSKAAKPTEKKKKDMKQEKGSVAASSKVATVENMTSVAPNSVTKRRIRKNAELILRNSSACPVRNKGPVLKCWFCIQTFVDPSRLRTHMGEDHPSIDKSTCLIKKNEDLQLRVDISDLRCLLCSTNFDELKPLAEHLHEVHSLGIYLEISLGVVPLKLEHNNYKCILCDQKFSCFIPLSRHMGTHYYQYICDICGFRCETIGGMSTHIKLQHSHKHMCRQCKVVFPTAQAKIEHIRISKNCMPYTCKLCKERFLYWELCQHHMEQVHGVPKPEFRCTECKAVFVKRMQLYKHFKSEHTDDHKCPYCERKFTYNSSLKEHVLSHTGQRPLVCPVCDKTFARGKAFRLHLAIHDDSKKAKCTQCNRMFVSRTKLKAHVKKHHPDTFLKEFPEKSAT
ncbi:zinc finger protein 184-like isoform X11 [Ostrinia nubilalis]|uniref:zinc finger protein 184-like isoform X11 n=1 Tax=Ostrinia nubilalis TaxID=29057 RepID=UPI00308235DA